MSLLNDIDSALYGHLKGFAKESPYNAALVANIPYLGNYARIHEQDEYLTDYIRDRGLSWHDVKYPFGSAVSSLPAFSGFVQGLGYPNKRRTRRSYSRSYRKRARRKYSRRWRR